MRGAFYYEYVFEGKTGMKLEASIVKKMKGFTLDVSLSAAQGEIVG